MFSLNFFTPVVRQSFVSLNVDFQGLSSQISGYEMDLMLL